MTAIGAALAIGASLIASAVDGGDLESDPDSAAVVCRFQVTGHSAAPSAFDRDGEWIASDQRGYHYRQIEADEIRPFPIPAVRPETEAQPWYYQRVDFSTLPARDAPPPDSAYVAERTYLRFNETGLYDVLLLVHEHHNGSWHASLFEADATFAMDPDSPGFQGIIRHGRGKCAPLDDPARVQFNPP